MNVFTPTNLALAKIAYAKRMFERDPPLLYRLVRALDQDIEEDIAFCVARDICAIYTLFEQQDRYRILKVATADPCLLDKLLTAFQDDVQAACVNYNDIALSATHTVGRSDFPDAKHIEFIYFLNVVTPVVRGIDKLLLVGDTSVVTVLTAPQIYNLSERHANTLLDMCGDDMAILNALCQDIAEGSNPCNDRLFTNAFERRHELDNPTSIHTLACACYKSFPRQVGVLIDMIEHPDPTIADILTDPVMRKVEFDVDKMCRYIPTPEIPYNTFVPCTRRACFK